MQTDSKMVLVTSRGIPETCSRGFGAPAAFWNNKKKKKKKKEKEVEEASPSFTPRKKPQSSWYYLEVLNLYTVWMTHVLEGMKEELWFILVNSLEIENRFHTWDEIARYTGLFATLSLCMISMCCLHETALEHRRVGNKWKSGKW